MRRLAAALVAAVLGAGLGVAVNISAADAYQTDQSCKTVFVDDTVQDQMCIGARVHALNGGGWNLDEVDISIAPGGDWESTAVACDWVKAFNDAGVARWDRESGCAVPRNPGYVTFYPNVAFPNSTTVTVQWAGWPKLNHAPDPGETKVRVILP